MRPHDLKLANAAYLRAMELLTEFDRSLPEIRSLLKDCESQLSTYLRHDQMVYFGTLTELSARLSAQLVKLSVLKYASLRLIDEARHSIENFRRTIEQAHDPEARADEIRTICDTMFEKLAIVNESLEAAYSGLDDQLQQISEMALTHDTPQELISVARELIERSKP